MTFDFILSVLIGYFVTMAVFAFMAFVADYVIPALFENNGTELDDYSE